MSSILALTFLGYIMLEYLLDDDDDVYVDDIFSLPFNIGERYLFYEII